MRHLKILFIALLIVSCRSGSSGEDLRSEITSLEDSITAITNDLAFGEKINPELNAELLDKLLQYYTTYPESDYAPECLDKLHMNYAGQGDYELSARYADTLINNYPDYINRALVLESQATNFDFYIEPRDTSKVRYYYELLLKEFPDLPKDKKEGIQDRLNHLELTIEQMILKNN